MIATDETLLDRLKDMDAHDAWQVFYDLYWQAIIRYACKLGLSETQAGEVLQDTMVTLMHVLPKFAYDPDRGKFRNFLLTIVHRKSLRTLRQHYRQRERDAAAGEWETSPLDGESQSEHWRASVFEAVLDELQSDAEIAPTTFAVFHEYAVKHRPAAEVAAEFRLSENAVHQIKSRMLRRLRAAVLRRLRDSGHPVLT